MAAPSFKNLGTKNRYWKIGARTYSVFAHAFIDTSDPDYLEWRHRGHDPIDVSDDDFRTAEEERDVGTFVAITAIQARRALRAGGYYDDVLTQVNAGTDAIKDNWACAINWHRDDAWVSTILTGAGLTSDQMDAVFVSAATL